MYSVAIVTAFSEDGYPLLKQCLASCDKCILDMPDYVQFSAFVYKCNWNPQRNPIITSFKNPIDISDDFPLRRIKKITQKDASLIVLKNTFLPDIAIYDDFARNHLNEFDYTLFCHNDIHFNDTDIFSLAVKAVNDNRWNMVAEPVMDCADRLTIRYRPHFIFINNDKFRQSNLSFANDYKVFREDFRIEDPKVDGGAGLLFSQFHKSNNTHYTATNSIPKRWVKHLRFDFCEMGIESYNVFHPNTIEFNKVMADANRFVDQYLYGKSLYGLNKND